MSADVLQLWGIAAALSLIVVAIMLVPLLKRRAGEAASREEYDINVYKDQLLEIDADLERGLLGADQAVAARTEIKRRMLAAADNGGATSSVTQTAGSNFLIIAVLVLAVPVGAVMLYLKLGSPDLPDQPLAARDMRAVVAQDKQTQKVSQSAAKLATFLQKNPDDMRGWMLLARTYLSLGRYPDAVDAYAQAYRLEENRPGLAVDYGEALTLAADSQITQAARVLFEKALSADNADPKAHYYLGLFKVQQDDIRGGMQQWINLTAMSPQGAPWLKILNQQIERAASDSGIDPVSLKPSVEAVALGKKIQQEITAAQAAQPVQTDAPGPSNADVKAAMGMSDGDRNQMIRTMVERLAGKMKDNPGDKDGWLRLERAYRVLGEIKKADEAAARAAKLP